MNRTKSGTLRAPTALDVATSIAARLTPRAFTPRLEQLRRDADRVLGDLRTAPELDSIDPLRTFVPSWLREGYDQLRRDVSAVRQGLAGDRPPPFRTRQKSAAAVPRAPASIATRSMRVVAVTHETEDAVSLTLAPTDGRAIVFVPGQFLTVQVTLAGERLRRAYSISNLAAADGTVTLTTKRVPGGRVSTHLHAHVREGDVLEVLGPSGGFTVSPDAGQVRHLVLLAGGSGITPIMAIVRAVLRDEPGTTLTLVYGNRRWRDVIFADALDALAAAHPGRLQVVHVLGEPHEGWVGARGMLEPSVVRDQLDALRVDHADGFYVCGPEPMRHAVRDELARRGVPSARVHEERFTAPNARIVPAAGASEPCVVTVRTRRGVHTVPVAPGQTVLEAGLSAQIDMPFSCAMGGCGECRMKLVEGEVDVERPNCLTDQERSDGYVLTCVGRPTRASSLEVDR